jgi:Ni,Fe-hydrogenase III large subunit/Ni,Fe-hydrogenase III component G
VTTHAVEPDELVARAGGLLGAGHRLAMIAGHDDGAALRVVYLFTLAGAPEHTELHVRLDRERPSLPSLARLSFPAGRFERELHDLYGVALPDHPLPHRLVRHFHWPRGWYPMRRDAGPPPCFADVDGPYPFRTVHGPGVYEIPVGPVHAGLIEPGHFRFSVVGETVLNLKARLWFVHRGVERLFQGRLPADGVAIAERISGDTSVGHSVAYCQAVEDATGTTVARRDRELRAVLLELERLHNHVTDLGALCNDVAHGILNVHAQRLRERLLRVNDAVTGHRLLRGAVRPGGTSVRALPDPDVLAEVAADAAELVALAMDHAVVYDRFAGTAVLTAEQATALGVLGYVARASGLTVDARHDHPEVAPGPRTAHTRTDGDVLSRFLVRADELAASVDTVAGLVAGLGDGTGPAGEPGGEHGPASGVGIVEGWRGTIVHRVELAADGTLGRVKVVDPSFLNWPALPVAMVDTIVADFPLVNKSFNLSYAGNDL